jgi:hypothetical protein
MATHAAVLSLEPPAKVETETPMARVAATQETSAAKISVPIQMFIAAIGTAVVLGGAFWQATGGVRSRLDVMAAKQDAAAEIARVRDDNTKAQLELLKDDLKSLRGKMDLLQLQQQQQQLDLVVLKGKG